MGARLQEIYDLVTKQAGFTGRVRLAEKTGVSREKAAEMEDNDKNLKNFKAIASEIIGRDNEWVDRGIITKVNQYDVETTDSGILKVISLSAIIYKPTTEQLIAMLEDKEWTIMHYWDYSPREKRDCWEYFVKTDNTLKDKICYGNTPQEAMLKLIAYERWEYRWIEPDGNFEGGWECIEA